VNLTELSKHCISILLVIFLAACGGGDGGNDSSASNPPEAETGCVIEGSANEIVSVLLIGNSLMGGVKYKLETLLTCGGYTPNIDISNPGGFWLYQHDENAKTLNLISQGFDLVLLQEQSGGIGSHEAPYATINSLKTKIEAAGSQMALYQTWAFSSRDPVTTEDILSHYEIMGDYFDVPVFHIGRAWDFFYTSNSEDPPFSLFSDDVHANTYGQSLIAYVLYSSLTGDSTLFLSSLSLNDEEAELLQTIAWDIFNAY
tara:strand:- start:239 stop:1012 length:774 start_codon:yes stop_codon:yes gene_type:complete